MTTTSTQPGSHRRRNIVIGLVAVIAAVVLGLVAVYLLFFASDAPDTPTLDNALKVLLPSATPE
jgi:flagellar basal body-associated protein FliL